MIFVFAHHLVGDPADPVASLTAECPVRLGRALHARGDRYHVLSPVTGRVCCLCVTQDPPDGFLPTPAQSALWGPAQADVTAAPTCPVPEASGAVRCEACG
jgi:hypothetical protein